MVWSHFVSAVGLSTNYGTGTFTGILSKDRFQLPSPPHSSYVTHRRGRVTRKDRTHSGGLGLSTDDGTGTFGAVLSADLIQFPCRQDRSLYRDTAEGCPKEIDRL